MDDLLKNIYQIRSKLGFSQEYMASQLGIKQSGYAMIEKGSRELKYSTLSQIAIVFKMDVIDVIKYPEKYASISQNRVSTGDIKAILQIELSKDKKDQVLKLVFGDNNLEILK